MTGIVKERLFTPGPTPLLLEAQVKVLTATLHHRTEDFRRVMRETVESLRDYFNTKNDVLIFASSGTGAMEGAVSNLVSPGERVLVGTAGKFGERWVALAKAYGAEVEVVEAPYGQCLPMLEMRKRLESQGPFRAVLVQATESSTGVSHDVKALGEMEESPRDVPRRGRDHRPRDNGLAPGRLGPGYRDRRLAEGYHDSSRSCLRQREREGLEIIEKSRAPRFYFDFSKERKNLAKGETSYTPATTLIVSLHAALEYIKKIGRENLIANAAMQAEATREAAKAWGLKLFATCSPSNAVTSIRAPEGMDSGLIVKEMRSRFGAIISNGQGSMKGEIFRLAHLGYYDALDLFAVTAGLEIALQKVGHKVDLSAGVRAAQEVYLQRCGN